MSRKKILIVDDSSDVRAALRLALEEGGYDVMEAADGVDGVEMAAAHKPDLIVIDMMMPRKDGFAASMEIKRKEGLERVPIIMLTGISDHVRGADGAKNVGVGAPVDLFLEKPLDPPSLIGEITRLLEAPEQT